jgi:hypothetical protein
VWRDKSKRPASVVAWWSWGFKPIARRSCRHAAHGICGDLNNNNPKKWPPVFYSFLAYYLFFLFYSRHKYLKKSFFLRSRGAKRKTENSIFSLISGRQKRKSNLNE